MEKQDLNQNDLAQVTGLSPGTISRILNRIWNPDMVKKIKIAKALGAKVEELFHPSSLELKES